jgi:hypothetical protein
MGPWILMRAGVYWITTGLGGGIRISLRCWERCGRLRRGLDIIWLVEALIRWARYREQVVYLGWILVNVPGVTIIHIVHLFRNEKQ